MLIVDPVDGTRPAAAGLEGAMVSVAVAELTEAPTMGDVVLAASSEIKSGTVFYRRARPGRHDRRPPRASRCR